MIVTQSEIDRELRENPITDAMIDRELALDPGIPMTCMCCRDEARRKIVERLEEDRRLGDRRAA